MSIQLSAPQALFLNCDNKYKAYVGGFGSGKTFVGCLDLLTFMLKHPDTPATICLQTRHSDRKSLYALA